MAAIPEYLKFYINGEWVDPVGELKTHEVIDPSTEKPIARIALGSKADVDRAVAAAKAAFPAFAATTPEYRADLLDKIVAEYTKRLPEIAKVISDEMGAPMWLANAAQAPAGLGHFATTAAILRQFKFEEMRGNVLLRKEPAGVCGLITPWNWPANQIACKVAPALAAGCTMVLKPSELAPLDAIIIAECIAAAGVPAGVFNLVNGDGPTVGTALSSSPDIDMMSFTGSTRAGILVAQAAAGTVKRVAQELGGKSANIITPDAPLEKAVTSGVLTMMTNSGQSCNAPSRMLIHKDQYDKAVEIAAAVASTVKVQPPKEAEQGAIGPVANGTQFKKINGLLQKGIDEGAKAVVGGPGRPEGLTSGYYIRPTIFANVNNQMTIAREEIFGPVLVMIPYNNLDEAVEIANDTPYGLSGYVYAKDVKAARELATKFRSGNVHLQGTGVDFTAPFGGYKQSGNGREWGEFGLAEFLETKAVLGAAEQSD